MSHQGSLPPPVEEQLETPRKRGPATPAAVVAFIEERAPSQSPAQIRKELETSPIGQRYGLPPERTVQAIAKAYRDRIASTPWSLLGADPADAALVLPVIGAALAKGLHGAALTGTTMSHGRWIARLARAVPDLVDLPKGRFEIWRFASVYQGREERKEPTDDLDAFFALAPWRDGGKAYVAAIAAGLVTTVHGGPFTPLEAFEALHERVAARSGRHAVRRPDELEQQGRGEA